MNAHVMLLIAEALTLAGLIGLFALYLCPAAFGQSTSAFSTARVAIAGGRFDQALSTLNGIESRNPDTSTAAEAEYVKAHVYRDGLRRPALAMSSYGRLATAFGSIAFPHKQAAAVERIALAGTIDRSHSTHPLYRLMAFFDRIAGGSYAIAILLLSLVVRILLAPLTFRQIAESKKMQALQPEIEKLQERHASNIAALSTAVRKLQEDNGVHPYLGAAIGVVQSLIFLAVYNAVALYQYHVIGSTFLWIGTPFAAHHGTFLAPTFCDPDLGLAAVYATILLLTQRLIAKVDGGLPTVSTASSMIGPVAAFVMVYFFHSPSAFVLYWIVSTVIGCVVECVARRRLRVK